ncbi:MAG TPA: histidine kinase [Allosphingosinicella sp.]|jgi:signal transduction histidine kinase
MSAAGPVSARFAGIGPRNPRTRGAIAVCLLFYAFTLMVFTVAGFFRGPESFRESLSIGVPMMIVDGFLSFQIYFLLGPASRLPAVPRWSLIVAGVVAIALLQAVWDTQLRLWAGSVDQAGAYLAYVRSATLNVYNTGMFAALIAFQGAYLDLSEHQRLLNASRESERDAHMLALRFQLNPHFLFNTLNAISSLVIVGRAAHAEAMIDRLSSFLRASLTADPHSLVSIDEEFEMLDSYLEIESVRFGDRLVTAIDLPPPLTRALMPPFLLQPLVENAIKYAVAPSTRPVEVRIAAEEQDGRLVLTVEDDGDGCGNGSPGTGVGLANVRERLRLNYGSRARLEMQQDGSGCRVRIVLPLELPDESVAAARPADVFA